MTPVTWFEELESLLPGRAVRDEASLAEASSDFGRMIARRPAVVVRPQSAEEIARVVAFARERKIAVSSRGQAHTQSGQTLNDGGIVLSTASLSRKISIDKARRTARCDGGVLWRDLVTAALAEGLIPPVLTNNLGVSIGGTLSIAGLGISSFRHGAQTDNALELTVVTGSGEIVTCSRERNRDLFDAVRSGLGQFGIIAEAELALREAKSSTRTYFLLYDDLAKLMQDTRSLMASDRFDYLESWCVPCPQGFRRMGGEPTAFAEWFFPLHATIEYGSEAPPDDTRALSGLSYYKHVHTEERPLFEFAARLEPLFWLWKRGGYWANAHPWMETILPWDGAAAYISQVLAHYPPHALGGGHVLLWPSRGTTSQTPLFMRPASEFVMGFGILPGLPKEFVPAAAPLLDRASDLGFTVGGKRYLSGLVHFDEGRWKAHFGEQWPKLHDLKRRYDPDGILNPGVLPV
jgi:cytokinin dehydrogenase